MSEKRHKSNGNQSTLSHAETGMRARPSQRSCLECVSHRRPFSHQGESRPQFETFCGLERTGLYYETGGSSTLLPLFLRLPLTLSMPLRSETRSIQPRSPKLESRSSKVQATVALEVFAYLNSVDVSKRRMEFRKRQKLFSQGESGQSRLLHSRRQHKGCRNLRRRQRGGRCHSRGRAIFWAKAAWWASRCGSRPQRR